MTATVAPRGAELSPAVAWSRRVLRVGGFIQLAFAAFWLVRGSLNIAGGVGVVLALLSTAVAVVVLGYGVRVTAGAAARPTSPEAKRIERAVTVATVIELVAALRAACRGHRGWSQRLGPPVHRDHDRTAVALPRPPGPDPPLPPGRLGADRRTSGARRHPVGFHPRRDHRDRRRAPSPEYRGRWLPRPRGASTSWVLTFGRVKRA